MESCADTQSGKQKQKFHFYTLVMILAPEDSHQRPEVEEEEKERVGGAELKGLRRDVRHAEDVFRTVKGIWSLCLPVRRSRERREGNTKAGKKREKKTDEKKLKSH